MCWYSLERNVIVKASDTLDNFIRRYLACQKSLLAVFVPAILYAHSCESPTTFKSANQFRRFYYCNMTFPNEEHERAKWPGCSLKEIATIGIENRLVCPYQATTKFACNLAGDQIRRDRRIKSLVCRWLNLFQFCSLWCHLCLDF